MGKLESNKKKKEDALFSSAFELFTSKGFNKTTISDIVEHAGIAKGTFYLYFQDKYDIRNKLISHKTKELFLSAHEALMKTSLTGFEEQLEFIIDFILNELENNHALLHFISKNLSWGVFRGALNEKSEDEGSPFYDYYLALLKKSGNTYVNEEMMLFTIIEMVGATSYNCILYEQPASLDEYKPYLYRAIHGILRSFMIY